MLNGKIHSNNSSPDFLIVRACASDSAISSFSTAGFDLGTFFSAAPCD